MEKTDIDTFKITIFEKVTQIKANSDDFYAFASDFFSQFDDSIELVYGNTKKFNEFRFLIPLKDSRNEIFIDINKGKDSTTPIYKIQSRNTLIPQTASLVLPSPQYVDLVFAHLFDMTIFFYNIVQELNEIYKDAYKKREYIGPFASKDQIITAFLAITNDFRNIDSDNQTKVVQLYNAILPYSTPSIQTLYICIKDIRKFLKDHETDKDDVLKGHEDLLKLFKEDLTKLNDTEITQYQDSVKKYNTFHNKTPKQNPTQNTTQQQAPQKTLDFAQPPANSSFKSPFGPPTPAPAPDFAQGPANSNFKSPFGPSTPAPTPDFAQGPANSNFKSPFGPTTPAPTPTPDFAQPPANSKFKQPF